MASADHERLTPRVPVIQSARPHALEALCAAESARIRRQFEADHDGRSAVRGRTKLIDRVVQQLWDKLFATEDGGIALVALGGFGREELFPSSDIDLLFLCHEFPDDRQRRNLSALCREMWDLRLRVSPTTRTHAQCDMLDSGNIEGAIALLDCRYLAGDRALFAQLRDDIVPRLVRREWQALVRGLDAVTSRRHQKYGNTVFHLEPNVKDAPGGLRDQHISRWLAVMAALDKQRAWPDPAALVPTAFREPYEQAREFFCAVRCFLHYRHGRNDNKLSWEAQDEAAAERIGMTRNQPPDAAEWMRGYYRHARASYRLATQVLDDVVPSRSSLYQQFQRWRSRLSNSDFSILGGRVFLQQSTAIRDPDVVLRLFSFVARHGLKVSADTERRIADVLPEIAPRLPRGPALWSHLRDILLGPDAAQALRALQGLGILTLLIPEFKLIESLVLRDYYHRYTVDEHSFLTIESLHRLAQPTGAWDQQFSELLSEVTAPDLLYLALLLHDLGKGRIGEAHVGASVEIAQEILARLGLSLQEQETVRFLISNHLEMSRAMRRDIFDPENVRALAQKVGTPERLRLLCLVTYADINSVHPESLTPWKAQNLWQLYIATARFLSRSVDQVLPADSSGPAARVLSVFPDRAEEIRAFLDGFPPRYVTRFGEQVAFHLQLASLLPQDGVQLALDANHHLFELTILTADRPRLFATIAAVLFAWGMDIVKADAFSSQAGFIVDTFLFRDRFRCLVLNPPERERFKRSLRDLLAGGGDVETIVRKRLVSERPGPPKVKIETRIEFDDECSPHSTVLEIIAQDRPGLLYAISSILSARQCNIDLALIDTEGQMAIDVFYLTCAGQKLDRAQQRLLAARLREDIGP